MALLLVGQGLEGLGLVAAHPPGQGLILPPVGQLMADHLLDHGDAVQAVVPQKAHLALGKVAVGPIPLGPLAAHGQKGGLLGGLLLPLEGAVGLGLPGGPVFSPDDGAAFGIRPALHHPLPNPLENGVPLLCRSLRHGSHGLVHNKYLLFCFPILCGWMGLCFF